MKIILASKSGVRKQILDKYKIDSEVMISNVDEDEVKESFLAEGADPLIINNENFLETSRAQRKHVDDISTELCKHPENASNICGMLQ